MAMSNKDKRDSPLVKSVLALDNYLAELERVGTRINSTDMTADVDIDYIQKLMTRFAECGQGVSEEVGKLTGQLLEARERAEAVAQGVAGQAELLNKRRTEQNEKLEKFRVLGEKVRELNAAISQFRPPRGQLLTHEDHQRLKSSIPALQTQVAVLIEELQELRQSARNARMRALEKNAESLAQTLQAVQKKLHDLGGADAV
jgi:chromosome segregation ATPase